MCVCVCMCVYIYVCIHMCVYICVYVYIYITFSLFLFKKVLWLHLWHLKVPGPGTDPAASILDPFYLFFCLFRAVPMAYGGSQATGLIRAVATRLCHSYSNARSEQHL